MIQRAPGSPGAPFDLGSPVDRSTGVEVGPVEVDPAAVVRLVLACPGVAAMHGGISGEAATYLPGRRVVGVRILPDWVEVHVVARWPIPASEIAAQVWANVARAVDGRRVDVVIGDVLMPHADEAP